MKVEQGAASQIVRIRFVKDGRIGVTIHSRRGGPSAPWEFPAIDTESPYLDERPLLVAGTPEVREYRHRFWDNRSETGDWSDPSSVTVGPQGTPVKEGSPNVAAGWLLVVSSQQPVVGSRGAGSRTAQRLCR